MSIRSLDFALCALETLRSCVATPGEELSPNQKAHIFRDGQTDEEDEDLCSSVVGLR